MESQCSAAPDAASSSSTSSSSSSSYCGSRCKLLGQAKDCKAQLPVASCFRQHHSTNGTRYTLIYARVNCYCSCSCSYPAPSHAMQPVNRQAPIPIHRLPSKQSLTRHEHSLVDRIFTRSSPAQPLPSTGPHTWPRPPCWAWAVVAWHNRHSRNMTPRHSSFQSRLPR